MFSFELWNYRKLNIWLKLKTLIIQISIQSASFINEYIKKSTRKLDNK